MADIKSVMQALKDSLENQHCGFIEGVGNVYAVSEETINDTLKLLKKQDAVKPNGTRKAMSFAFNGMLTGYCPRCGTIVNSVGNSGACGKCGQKFDWDNLETEDMR